MDYNTLWKSYQKALKRIEVLEKRLEKLGSPVDSPVKKVLSGKKKTKEKEE